MGPDGLAERLWGLNTIIVCWPWLILQFESLVPELVAGGDRLKTGVDVNLNGMLKPSVPHASSLALQTFVPEAVTAGLENHAHNLVLVRLHFWCSEGTVSLPRFGWWTRINPACRSQDRASVRERRGFL